MTNDNDTPSSGHRPVPSWIKVMWVLGVIWVIAYIIGGLQKGPTSW